jgi:predicted nucleic acid-binding protein
MNERYVLDAWALIAFLQEEEPASLRVRQLLQNAQNGQVSVFVSVMNVGEIFYRIGKVRGEREARTTLESLRRLSLTIVSATDDRVFAAASLKLRYAIPYADAFAAATAIDLGATLVTGDPEFDQLADTIKIEKLSRHRR